MSAGGFGKLGAAVVDGGAGETQVPRFARDDTAALGWRDRPGMRSVPGDDGYPDPVDYQWVPLGPPSLLSTHRK